MYYALMILNLLGQSIAPPTSGYSSPWYERSGGATNPSSWAVLVEKLGVPAFFALIIFLYFGWREWRQSREPSNREQVGILRATYEASVARDTRMRRVLRAWCDVAMAFAEKDTLNDKVRPAIERIQDSLDNGSSATSSNLLFDTDSNDNWDKHHGRA